MIIYYCGIVTEKTRQRFLLIIAYSETHYLVFLINNLKLTYKN